MSKLLLLKKCCCAKEFYGVWCGNQSGVGESVYFQHLYATGITEELVYVSTTSEQAYSGVIATDDDGYVSIIFSMKQSPLFNTYKYYLAQNITGSWVVEEIPDVPNTDNFADIQFPTLQIDSTGKLHWILGNYYYTKSGSTWTKEAITRYLSTYLVLHIDSNDNPHFINQTSTGKIKIARRTTGSWVYTDLKVVGAYSGNDYAYGFGDFWIDFTTDYDKIIWYGQYYDSGYNPIVGAFESTFNGTAASSFIEYSIPFSLAPYDAQVYAGTLATPGVVSDGVLYLEKLPPSPAKLWYQIARTDGAVDANKLANLDVTNTPWSMIYPKSIGVKSYLVNLDSDGSTIRAIIDLTDQYGTVWANTTFTKFPQSICQKV